MDFWRFQLPYKSGAPTMAVLLRRIALVGYLLLAVESSHGALARHPALQIHSHVEEIVLSPTSTCLISRKFSFRVVCVLSSLARLAHNAGLAVPAARMLRHAQPALPRVTAAPVSQQPPPYATAMPPPLGSRPPPPRGGLALSAGGLVATLFVSSSALSMTGTIATIAASFAGVFSFKLAKDLSNRGVSKGTVQRIASNAFTNTAQLGVRGAVSLGIATAYAVASVVSLAVWLLTRLGESVLYVAELTDRLKPSPDATPPYPPFEGESYPDVAPPPAASRPPPATAPPPQTPAPPTAARSSYLPRGFAPSSSSPPPTAGEPATPPPRDYRYASTAAAAYANAQRASIAGPPPPPAPPSPPADPREVGRQLAVQQMLS